MDHAVTASRDHSGVPVWSTRPHLGDPATYVHANTPDTYDRPGGPACGTSSGNLRYLAWTTWADVPTISRCAACTRALQQPPAAP